MQPLGKMPRSLRPGIEALSFREATARIGTAVGRKLQFDAISDEEAGE